MIATLPQMQDRANASSRKQQAAEQAVGLELPEDDVVTLLRNTLAGQAAGALDLPEADVVSLC